MIVSLVSTATYQKGHGSIASATSSLYNIADSCDAAMVTLGFRLGPEDLLPAKNREAEGV